MKASFIWDLDGTLLDSYGVIAALLKQTFSEFGAELDEEEIRRSALQRSAMSLIKKVAAETGKPYSALNARFGALSEENLHRIRIMEGGREVLDYLSETGAQQYVFTNRGEHSKAILERLGIRDCFAEIVTGSDGFPRKPAGDAVVYLVGKYGLDPEHAYYVGDRLLDIECALNAGIKSILFAPEDGCVAPTGKETFVIRTLAEIRELAEKGEL